MAAGLCYGVRGGGAQLCFHVQAGNYDTDTLIQVLGELHKFLGGEKAALLWDGLPAHRSRAMQAWLHTQRHWLVVERLPAYAPELNPVQGLWSWLQGSQLANLICPPWKRRPNRPSWVLSVHGERRTLLLDSATQRPVGRMTRDGHGSPGSGRGRLGLPWSGIFVGGAPGDDRRSTHQLGGAGSKRRLQRAVHTVTAQPVSVGRSSCALAARLGHWHHPGHLLLPSQGTLQRARARCRRNPVPTVIGPRSPGHPIHP